MQPASDVTVVININIVYTGAGYSKISLDTASFSWLHTVKIS
jgi:hypothetical protein